MTLLFDIETDGLLDKVTKIHCIVVRDTETGEVATYGDHAICSASLATGVNRLNEADEIWGHNVLRFDVPVIQKFYPWFSPKLVRDTLICSRLIWPNLAALDKRARVEGFPGQLTGRHSLEAWGWRLKAHKGDFGKTTDWKEFTPEMLKYCIQDVEGPTLALWKLIKSKKYSEQAIEVEHDFDAVMMLQEEHGFRFDEKTAHTLHSQLVKRRLELIEILQQKYPGWWEDMKTPEYWTADDGKGFGIKAHTKSAAEDELWKVIKPKGYKRKDMILTPGPMAKKHTPFNPGSRDQIIRVLIEEHKWKPVKFTDGGRPTLDEETLESLNIPEAPHLLEYLMIDKRLSALAEGDSAWLKMVKNGRIHHRVNHMGTVTSRCSHEKPNLGQVVAVDKPYGKEFRALFLPDEGHVLVGADASGIQLRVIAHYATRWDGGQYTKLITTGDVHTANQQAAGLPTRATAKTFIYAWLLGGGDPKIGAIIGKGPTEGKLLKKKFLAGFPALRELKEELDRVARRQGFITGLDGRHLPCANGHAGMGSLLQGFEAVVMKKATKYLYDELSSRGLIHGRDYSFCAFVHDEFQLSCRKEIADDIGRAAVAAITRAGEHFQSLCPLAGEYKIGANWCETH